MKLLTYLSLILAGSFLVALFSVDTARVSTQLKARLSTPLNPTQALADSSQEMTVSAMQRSVAGHILHLQNTTPAECQQGHMLLEQESRLLPPSTVYNQKKNAEISQWISALCPDKR